MKNRKNRLSCTKFCCLLFLLIGNIAYSQQPVSKTATLKTISRNGADMFGTKAHYIENIGQYGEKMAGYHYMGAILYGYEELSMPVLFTSKGIIHLHKQLQQFSYDEISKRERRRWEKIEKKIEAANENIQVITMEWINANPNPQIIAEEEATAYHTYGQLKKKARAYKKITYKNLYPGIDLEYSFIDSKKAGFEYSLLVKPGADISIVKMKYGGAIKKIEQDKDGSLVIHSTVDGIIESAPVGYYTEPSDIKKEEPGISFSINKNVVSFKLPANYNKEKTLVIDPFVTNTNSLTGLNTSKAKDIDFDYAGNVYVSGGGDASIQKLAKFDAAGTLLWTFTGSLIAPFWDFGTSYGGWVVEKTTGNIYLGQGISSLGGFSVIRLSSTGIYDNYITTPNSGFGENWRMIYSCHGGIATILIAGGGGSANNELALLSPPSLIPATSNLSGLTGGHNDISDIVIDPLNDELYTIYSTSVNATGSDNVIYKHLPPYSTATKIWSAPSQFFALREPVNRPYLSGFDNSSNTLAVNSNYLFYWDGKNLKAINKATGAAVGSPLIITTNSILQQGGIYADECNNVFIGSVNGTIKVYKFNGNSFDDAVADISIAGFSSKEVYDLTYDNGKQLLYASGNGFVASIDIASYCPATIYAVTVVPDCVNLSAKTNMSPLPPVGTSLNYTLYDGSTIITSNTTGVFSNLTIGINYTIKIFLNQACGGTQATGSFILTNPPVLSIHNPATICIPKTTDLTDANITAGSSAGLTYSYWQDANATIPCPVPTAAPAGNYYIKAVAISGCTSIAPIAVNPFPIPIADAGNDATICFGDDIQLNGSGGLIYTWSPVIKLSDPNIQNPVLKKPNVGPNTYSLKVTDLNGCESQVDGKVTITVTTPAKLFIGNDTAIAINQPLQLNAIDVNNSGLINYTWTPAYGLNNTHIPNPIAILDKDIIYILNAATAANCKAAAAIRVKVYKGPEIYVPTAFTPGNNGLNDVLRAIPVGIKTLNYFSIYNRYGQLVFTTADPRKGWDGKINGVEQGSNVFVWMAEAIDYKGNIIRRKGTCAIIR